MIADDRRKGLGACPRGQSDARRRRIQQRGSWLLIPAQGHLDLREVLTEPKHQGQDVGGLVLVDLVDVAEDGVRLDDHGRDARPCGGHAGPNLQDLLLDRHH